MGICIYMGADSNGVCIYIYRAYSNRTMRERRGDSNGFMHMWECDSDHSRGNSDWASIYIYISDSK